MKSQTSRYLVLPVTLAVLFLFSSLFAEDANRATQDRSVVRDTLHTDKKPTGHTDKKPAGEYWKEFKRDTSQTWKDSRSAFRDGWMEGKLETALIINEHLSPYTVESSVDNGTASLTGEVSSEIDRELAESIALGIEGIDSVDNRLTVNANLAQNREDEEEDEEAAKTTRNFSQYMIDVSTTAGVKTELLKSPQINGMAIDVNTFNGRVTLSGTVKTRQEREVAEAMAKQHKEVKKVLNNLEVAS